MTRVRRVAVTGSSGRIGAAVVDNLVERGIDVVCIDRRAPHGRNRFADHSGTPRTGKFIYLDCAERYQLQPVLETCDAVAHLGEIPNIHAGESHQDVFSRNVRTGSTVLQTCADLGMPRVVYASTCQVYGLWGDPTPIAPFGPNHLPMTEAQPVRPLNGYALSKVANESFARLMTDLFGMSIACLRMPMVITRELRREWLGRKRFESAASLKYHDGVWSYLDVRDAADAFACALLKPRRPQPGADFEIYHLTADDVIGTIPLQERLNWPDFAYLPPLPADHPPLASLVDCTKAKTELGWQPKHRWTDD